MQYVTSFTMQFTSHYIVLHNELHCMYNLHINYKIDSLLISDQTLQMTFCRHEGVSDDEVGRGPRRRQALGHASTFGEKLRARVTPL